MDITKKQLKAALARWEQLHRDGGCRTDQEAAANSVEEVASVNAEYLWRVLSEMEGHATAE